MKIKEQNRNIVPRNKANTLKILTKTYGGQTNTCFKYRVR